MLDIGITLQLIVVDTNNNINRYRCKLIDKNKESLIIDYPVHDATQKTAIFENGTDFTVHYVVRGDVYQFKSKLLKRIRLKNIPGLAIARPTIENIKKIQRRHFARVNAFVNIAIHSPEGAFEPYITVTHDISGGGVSIVAPKKNPFEPGMMVEIWIVIQSLKLTMHYIKTKGEVVGSFDQDSHHNRISFKFTDISESKRQALISYVFEKQREERRKEFL